MCLVGPIGLEPMNSERGRLQRPAIAAMRRTRKAHTCLSWLVRPATIRNFSSQSRGVCQLTYGPITSPASPCPLAAASIPSTPRSKPFVLFVSTCGWHFYPLVLSCSSALATCPHVIFCSCFLYVHLACSSRCCLSRFFMPMHEVEATRFELVRR